MSSWDAILVACLVSLAMISLVGAAWWFRHRRRRDQLYRELAEQRIHLLEAHHCEIASPDLAKDLSEPFQKSRLVTVENFLSSQDFDRIRAAGIEAQVHMERGYIPLHKKGGTVSYESLQRFAHPCVAFYHSGELMRFVSRATGVDVVPTPDRDQSSLSLLCYTEAGDHIQWHYDHNFYVGRHFTVLLPLVNSGRDGGLSSSQFQRQLPGRAIQEHATAPNTLIIFEGARVRHRATPLGPGECRLMLSMTYTSDPRISRFKEFVRRLKDVAFYGWRALWD